MKFSLVLLVAFIAFVGFYSVVDAASFEALLEIDPENEKTEIVSKFD